MDLPVWAKPNQQTTPLEVTLSPEDTVTVVDPRHPLFGQTLSLIGITNKQYLGRCCIVWLRAGMEQLVPLAATDRSPDPLVVYSLPLNLPSVRQLLATYERFMSQPAEGTRDGGFGGKSNICPSTSGRSNEAQASTDDRVTYPAEGSVGFVECGTTAEGPSDDHQHLLQSGLSCDQQPSRGEE